VFVPHWVVPVGSDEVLVNALTQKLDPEARACSTPRRPRRGPALDAPRSVRFLSAPEPTATLLRELREAIPGAHVAGARARPVEWLFVPFIPSGDGYVNGITGANVARPGRARGHGGPGAPDIARLTHER